MGMTLRTKPEEIYRALIEATAYGTRVIMETFDRCGIPIEQIVASGGVSSLDDVVRLREQNLYGAIIGKAYYTGAIDLKQAIEVAK